MAEMDVCLSVQLDHKVVDQFEVVQVVDFFLFDSCLENLGPNLLIIPADSVKLFCQIEQRPLVEPNFFLPERHDHVLLKVSVK